MFKNSILAIALAFAPLMPVTAATLDFNPTNSVGTIGQSFSVDVQIADITDLYAFQFDIGFNPAVLVATQITEGSFLSAAGSTLFIAGNIDNAAGSITGTTDVLNGAVPGVDGSGVFATIDFKIVGSGTSNINLFNSIFLDSTLTDISVNPINHASIIVNNNINPGIVPEPGLLSLFALGGVLVSWKGRQRRK